MDPNDQDVVVTAVSFGEDTIEITYAERREQSEVAGAMRSIMVSRELVPEIVDDLLDSLIEVIDRGWVAIRNPPATRPRRDGVEGGRGV